MKKIKILNQVLDTIKKSKKNLSKQFPKLVDVMHKIDNSLSTME